MVDTRRKRVWKFQLEVYSLSADTADRLRRVYLFLVAVELRPLSAVVVGAKIRLCHSITLLVGPERLRPRRASIAHGIPSAAERESPSPF